MIRPSNEIPQGKKTEEKDSVLLPFFAKMKITRDIAEREGKMYQKKMKRREEERKRKRKRKKKKKKKKKKSKIERKILTTILT
jgi:hypothetical protein